jgi:hypothetical protein
MTEPNYSLLVADNGATTEIPLGTITVIPADAHLMFTVPQETMDADFEIIREQIKRHFAERRVTVIRAGDLQVLCFTEPNE